MARSVEDMTHAWFGSLALEGGMSGHPLRAYGDDVRRFLGFLFFHGGGPVTLAALRALRPADIRAFLTRRRAEGLGPRGVQRALAGLRSFYRYLQRENLADGAALSAVRSPKLPRTLPRPLSEVDAVRAIADSGQEDEPWIAARNAALLTLLYGTGLRISEALSLKRGDAPLGESLTIIGKGNKERAVPVLAAVREAVEQYARICPFDAGRADPLFVSRRGKPMSPREAQALMQNLRGRLGLAASATPHALRHSFATHLLQNGGGLITGQEIVGQASLSDTQKKNGGEGRPVAAVQDWGAPRAGGM